MSVINNLASSLDMYGNPIGRTLDTSTNTAGYKFYSGTTSGSPVIIDVETALGRQASSFTIVNTTTTASPDYFLAQISTDGGTNYGDSFPVYTSFARGFDYFIKFTHIKITQHSSATTYDLMVI